MRKIIFPYKFGSASAKLLAKAIGAIRIRDIGRYRRREGDVIINWGNSTVPTFGELDLNKTSAVNIAADKIKTLTLLKEKELRTVEWTTSREEAQTWLSQGHSVYARTKTRAKGGEGIIITSPVDAHPLPQAPLYTKAIRNSSEYRVHVCEDHVLDYTKKVPLSEHANPLVRSHSNGWTFARNIPMRDSIVDLACNAINQIGLDFGAVDIIVDHDNKNRAFILEVNSAPGLVGRTLEVYSKELTHIINTR